MDTDIRDEIDRSFGDGPAVDDSQLLVTRGRAAVRRRRWAEGGSVLLVAGAVVVAALVASGGTTESSSPGPAGTPTTSLAADPTPVVPDVGVDFVVDDDLSPGSPIDLRSDGVHIRPGVRVQRAIDNPYELTLPSRSFAAAYVEGGTTFWYAAYIDDGGGAAAIGPAEDGVSFRDWVDEQSTIVDPGTAGGHGGGDETQWPGQPDLQLVRFRGSTEALQPLGAVTILEQRAHPALPDGFATDDDRSAVAEVRFEGERYYVLARRTADGSPPQYIAVAAKDGGATLDDFLDLARGRYAEGGGGLL